MSKAKPAPFDCVQYMREQRDRLSREMATMSFEDFVHRLRSRRYSDPFLQRMAERMAREAGVSQETASHRKGA